MSSGTPAAQNKGGFTLAELLIVVAILGVLAAVAVPAFASTLEKSRETVCLNNRIVLQRHLMYDLMGDEKKEPTQAALGAYMDSDKAKCPAGGTYQLEYNKATGSIAVSCSKHARGGLTNQVAALNAWKAFLATGPTATDQFDMISKFKEYLSGQNSDLPSISQAEVLALYPEPNKPIQGLSASEELIWLPVQVTVKEGTLDLLVVTSSTLANGGHNGREGYLFYCESNGKYYRSDKTHPYSGNYTSAGLYSNHNDKSTSFADFIASKGWVEVEK